MPNVPSPPNAISAWNDHKKNKKLRLLFKFSFEHLTDNCPLLIFVHEKKDVRNERGLSWPSMDLYWGVIGGGFNELALFLTL